MKGRRVSLVVPAVLCILGLVFAVKIPLAGVDDGPAETDAAGTGFLFVKSYEGWQGEMRYGEVTSEPGEGYIMAGETYPPGYYLMDAWLVKVDDNGSIEWQKGFDGNEERRESAECVRRSATGDYFIAGTSYPKMNAGGGDYWLVFKLDQNGNPVWAKRWGKPGYSQLAHFVEPTDDGGCIVAGEAPPPSDWRNTFTVLKFDADGNLQFQRAYVLEGRTAIARSIQQTDSGYILAGELHVGDDREAWVLKLDDNGTVVWQKRYGDSDITGWDAAHSVRQTPDGGYIVAGGTNSWGAGWADVWVLKLDPQGDPVWQYAYGGEGGDWASSVWTTTDGGYLVAGIRNNLGGDSGDMWAIKLKGDGSLAWQRIAGSNIPDTFYSAREKGGAYFLSGTKGYGRGGSYHVFKLDDNGTIPDCDQITASQASVTATPAVPVATTAQTANPNIQPVAVTLTETATGAVSKTQCSAVVTERPNLAPYKPPGWSDRVVVSRVTGTHSDDSPLTTADDLYVDLAVWNEGPGATEHFAWIDLYLDGEKKSSWKTLSEMAPGDIRRVQDHPLGKLGAGVHHLRAVVDQQQDVEETDESDNAYTKTVTIAQANGSLTVTITPPFPTGAKWRVNGGSWMDGGQTLSLPPGNYTLTFSSHDGWNTPPAQSITIESGKTTTAKGTYTRQTGSLKVTIQPAKAREDGAQWSVDGGTTWRNSGSTATLPTGTYEVIFKAIPGWIQPNPQSVTIDYGESKTAVGTYKQLPNLKPHKPQGWSDAIVVSKVKGTYADTPVLYTNNDLFIDLAVINEGPGATWQSAQIDLLVDGKGVGSWATSAVMAAQAVKKQADIPIGRLPAGPHEIKVVVDSGSNVPETDETDNTYTKVITIQEALPNLFSPKPSDWSSRIVVSTKTGTHTDDTPLYSNDILYVDWMLGNNGVEATSGAFTCTLFLDGSAQASWTISGPLEVQGVREYADIPLGPLGAGTHTIRLVLDSEGTVKEMSEGDNEYTRTITIRQAKGPNLVPYKPADWPDVLVVYPKEGWDINDHSLYTTDDLYLDCAIANIGNDSAQNFHVALYIDGVLELAWLKRNAAKPNWYYWWKRINIGQLSAGTHELKLVVDSDREVVELNESDNAYTRTIEVKEAAAPPRASSTRIFRTMGSVKRGSGPLE